MRSGAKSGGGGADAVILGGGAVGCAIAWRLAQAGLGVALVERGEPGGEATWAAGGILGAQMESVGPGPMLSLGLASRALHPALAEELLHATGIDVGFHACGVLELAFSERDAEALRRRCEWQTRSELAAELVGGAFCQGKGGSPRAISGLFLPHDGRLDNRLFGRALALAAERAGVRFVRGEAREVLVLGGAVAGVALAEGSIEAGRVVVAGGAWSGTLRGAGIPAGAVRPVRGQVIALALRPPFDVVLGGPSGYAIPRGQDRVLVGATQEEAGFDKTATQEGTDQMRAVAALLSPALAAAPLLDRWAGLRPGSADGLPLIGAPVSGPRGLIVATGHFRNGILLTPITAEIVRDLVVGRAARIDPTPFRPDRPFPASVGGGRPQGR
jgi:glycine oxidase